MKLQHITHRHGGRILEVTGIEHGIYERRPYWNFIGIVDWDDGSGTGKEVPIDVIAPCFDRDNPESQAEMQRLGDALNDYLRRNGEWLDRGRGGWKPNAKKGREALA